MRLASILTVLSMLALAPSERAFASFAVNANLAGGTQTCASATGLTFTPGATSTVSYSCATSQTTNTCTMSGDLNYQLNTATVDVGCSNLVATGLVVDATFGGVQNADGTMSGLNPGGICNAATNVAYALDSNTVSWTCGTYNATCTPVADTTSVFDLAQNKLTVQCVSLGPTGTGLATPNSLPASADTLLTVTVNPAGSPVSSISVVGDLSGIGGSALQAFVDNGTAGDVTASDGVYSFRATLPLTLLQSPGAKNLPITIADAQSRTSVAQIALSVLTPTWPQGSGLASPGSVSPTTDALLTVTTSAGNNPASSALSVVVDLSSIGGSATQPFYDDGINGGDAQAGDGLFSYTATIPYPTPGGAKALTVKVSDAQGRQTQSTLSLEVLASTNPAGFAEGQPDNVSAGGTTLLTVLTTPGKHPTSAGIGVAVDLSAIGGSASQTFYDDGTHGDVTAGDGVYSWSQMIGAGAAPGPVDLPVAVVDTLARSSNGSLPLNITVPGGLAAAGNRPTVTVGKPVTLRVTVTPGVAPLSTGVAVTADLTSIGGSATQALWDDGSGADQTPGDNIFTMLLDLVPTNVPSGPMRLPAIATDNEGRSATTSIVVQVRGDALTGDGFEDTN